MKILLGSFLRSYGKSSLAIEIPGLGVIPAKLDIENIPFQYIELDKSQLIKLKKIISEEIKE